MSFISWQPYGLLVVSWDTFHASYLIVRCSLHWDPPWKGILSATDKEAFHKKALAQGKLSFRLLQLSLGPTSSSWGAGPTSVTPAPQAHVPRKLNQSMVTISKCKHRFCRGTGCPMSYIFEVDCVDSVNQILWQLFIEKKVWLAQQHWKGFWLSNI